MQIGCILQENLSIKNRGQISILDLVVHAPTSIEKQLTPGQRIMRIKMQYTHLLNNNLK